VANSTVDISHGDAESVGVGDFVRGFASGGRPTPGEVVLVGEHGLELLLQINPAPFFPDLGHWRRRPRGIGGMESPEHRPRRRSPRLRLM
jgi:hypothetical protein